MQKYLFILLLAILPFSAFCQQCSCEEKFQFVKHQMEYNYAGFKDKVTANNRKAYDAYTKGYLDKIKKTEKPAYCFALISEWLTYFKDGHIQAYAPYDEDSLSLAERINNTETFKLTHSQEEELMKSKGIEGIYAHNDTSYTIAIVKDKNEYRDYVGVILNSKTELWKPGQVKMEIKEQKGDKYQILLFMRDHSYRLQEWKYDGASLNDGEWIKTGVKKPTKKQLKEDDLKAVQARKLSDKTLYIQIGTFSERNAKAIDSVFKANEAALHIMPNLILDLRSNGGGADFAYRPIVPYIYTNPIVGTGGRCIGYSG